MGWIAIQRASYILVLFILGLGAGEAISETREMAIVAGTHFPEGQLTLEEVKAIYLGEIQILRHLRIHPIDQSYNRPIRAEFLKQVLRMTRDQYIDYWNKWLFQKGGLTPQLKDNSREVLKAVQEQEGAMGYIWLEEAREEAGIKILLTIDLE